MTRFLQDRISRGLGTAARALGQPTDAFRPRGPHHPLAMENRYLRLFAHFMPGRAAISSASSSGGATWQGFFDSAYTKVGDYLVQGGETFFIAAQPHLGNVVCVQTNRTLSIHRRTTPEEIGGAAYEAEVPTPPPSILTEWPAHVVSAGNGSNSGARLPDDLPTGQWRVQLPILPNTILRAGNIVTDDLGRHGTVTSFEQTAIGWRLLVAEARV